MYLTRDLSGGRFARAFCMALAGFLVAGCQPRQIDVETLAHISEAPGADRAACPAHALPDLAGHPFTALADIPLPDGLRILRPGQTVTPDLQPRRLNAQVDDRGRILRLFCG